MRTTPQRRPCSKYCLTFYLPWTGNLALLTLLDLSAAFDSVDHTTLLRRLQKSYALCGSVLSWFTSCLTARTQYVRTSVTSSSPSVVLYDVPQSSVLGPILFVLYTADVLQLVRDHGLVTHAYADDTQILGICPPSETDALQSQVSRLPGRCGILDGSQPAAAEPQ